MTHAGSAHGVSRRTPQSRGDMTVRVDWRAGPRTAAWDLLWRRILTAIDLGAEPEAVTAPLPTREDRDG